MDVNRRGACCCFVFSSCGGGKGAVMWVGSLESGLGSFVGRLVGEGRIYGVVIVVIVVIRPETWVN